MGREGMKDSFLT